MHFETFFRQCFVRKLRFGSKLILYSESALKTESIHIFFKLFCEKYFFWKKIPVTPLRNGLVNDDNFFDSSVISWRIILIFELDRDIDEIILCTKFHDNWMSLSKVIVYTDGRPDTQTDSRVYSLFEYTKRRKIEFSFTLRVFSNGKKSRKN